MRDSKHYNIPPKYHIKELKKTTHFDLLTFSDGKLLQGQYFFAIELKDGDDTPLQGMEVNFRIVLLGDHTNQPKEGRCMPGVVTLSQNSETSSKPGFFRGHNWGFISVLIQKGKDKNEIIYN